MMLGVGWCWCECSERWCCWWFQWEVLVADHKILDFQVCLYDVQECQKILYLSLMLRDCKSRMVSFISWFSVVTLASWVVIEESWENIVVVVCWSDLFSCVSVPICCWLYSRLWRRRWNYFVKYFDMDYSAIQFGEFVVYWYMHLFYLSAALLCLWWKR